MSYFHSLFLLFLVSISAAFLFLYLGSEINPPEYRGGYAELTVDESTDEKTLLPLLDNINSGGPLLSESSQWVMLDEFGEVSMIPLNEYSNRIYGFDPRNDGYGDKLKNFFIRDGKRRVYIPLKEGSSVPSALEKELSVFINDIPYAVNYYGIGKPLRFYFILFAAASLCLLVICCVHIKNKSGIAGLLFPLASLSSLAFFGAQGIAAASLTLGMFAMLREPLNELVSLSRSGIMSKTQRKKQLSRDVFKPYKFCWFFLPVFLTAIAVITYQSRIISWFMLSVFLASSLIFLFSLKTISLLKSSRRRFSPVLIIKRITPEFGFSVYMLPFVFAVIAALLITPSFSGTVISSVDPGFLIDEKEYFAHLEYQSSFSTRRLGGDTPSAYSSFLWDKDGLPAPLSSHGQAHFNKNNYPPFPLKHLMEFLNNAYTGKKITPDAGYFGFTTGYISLFITLLFFIPAFFMKNKTGFSLGRRLSDYKTGKKRRTDIDRNKVMIYNKSNKLKVQAAVRDA